MKARLAALRERLAGPAVRVFYGLTTGAMGATVWLFGRYRVTGREHMPRTGPVIVVANHLHNADPPLLGAALPRRVRFMAKQELYDSPAGVFMRLFGAFPVRREDADLAALRRARAILKNGEVLGMFPEGHRSDGRGLGPARPGSALLALRSGAPLLPVAITGTEAITGPGVLLRKPPIRVVIGEPFTLPAGRRVTAAEVEAGAEEIMRRIAALLPERYRGVYAVDAPVQPLLPATARTQRRQRRADARAAEEARSTPAPEEN